MREQVLTAASQAWREPVWALWLGRAYRTRISFEVPGLRHDGTIRGDHPVRWFFRRLPWGLAMTLGYTVTAACSLFWVACQVVVNSMIFDMDGTDNGTAMNWRRMLGIRAAGPLAHSVAAGRQLTRKRGHLWLVVSAHGAAFTQVVNGRQEVLWTDHSPARPQLVFQRGELCWPDASAIDVPWPGRELHLFGPFPQPA